MGSLDTSSLTPSKLVTGSFELAEHFNVLSPESSESWALFKIINRMGLLDLFSLDFSSTSLS